MTCIMLAGLPGAGKSVAAEQLKELTGGEIIHAGDMIRDIAAEHGLTDPTSDEIGEFAARMRDERGPAFYAEDAISIIEDRDVSWPIIMDSVRHNASVERLRDEYGDDATLLWMSAAQSVRLQRLRNRGRDDEATFDLFDLMLRDCRELCDLGVATIAENKSYDEFIVNEYSKSALETKLRWITDGIISQ